jgi:transcriptional regulator with XRE-family HTH domain
MSTIPRREWTPPHRAATTGPVSLVVESDHFARELRRWRTSRRWSQLELAVRAETTQRHLSFLEQGRSRPGRAMVVRLAETLGLSLRERNGLLLAAGYAPAFAESDLDGRELRPVREAVDRILEGHLPYPAVIVRRPYGELVAANEAQALLVEGVAPELLEPPVNALRLALHPDGMASRVENLAEWGRHVVENVRAQARRSPDPRLDQLIAELEGYVPPGHAGTRLRRLRGPAPVPLRPRGAAPHHDADIVRDGHGHHVVRTAARSVPARRRDHVEDPPPPNGRGRTGWVGLDGRWRWPTGTGEP